MVRNDRDRVVLDLRQRMPGRGAYVHRDADCIERAVRRGGMARTLRTKVDPAVAGTLLEALAGISGTQGI